MDLKPGIDYELVHDMLFGPVYYRLLLSGAPLDAELAQRIVERCCPGSPPNTEPSPPNAEPAHGQARALTTAAGGVVWICEGVDAPVAVPFVDAGRGRVALGLRRAGDRARDRLGMGRVPFLAGYIRAHTRPPDGAWSDLEVDYWRISRP